MTVEFTANGTGSSSVGKASLKWRTLKRPGLFLSSKVPSSTDLG